MLVKMFAKDVFFLSVRLSNLEVAFFLQLIMGLFVNLRPAKLISFNNLTRLYKTNLVPLLTGFSI